MKRVMKKVLPCSIAAIASSLLIAHAGLASGASTKPAGAACEEAGPQAPRDIDEPAGTNPQDFDWAPAASEMNLCNIHFHKFAEHRAKAYSTRRGEGKHAGWACMGHEPGPSAAAEHGEGHACEGVAVGDTIEVHWVFTTCDVEPGPRLESCGKCEGQKLRVEAGIFYLTEGTAGDFAPPPSETVRYKGSTTGTSYGNETCSEAQVTWNVPRDCSPLPLARLDDWCATDGRTIYKGAENHAHGVRKLVEDERFLSEIRN